MTTAVEDLANGLGLLRMRAACGPGQAVPSLQPTEARAVLDELERLWAAIPALRNTNIVRSNLARIEGAARRTTARAGEALRMPHLPEKYRRVLEVRASHPDLSLSECSAMLGMTKDAYAGRLKRALEWAEGAR